MEENKIPAKPPVNGTPPVLNTFPTVNQEAEPSSNRFVLMLVIGVVIIIVLVGGIYLYLSRQQASSKVNQTPPPAGGSAPAPVVQENLESDLNAIDVASPDADFTSVDSDLQQL